MPTLHTLHTLQTLQTLLTSDAALTLLVALLGALWTFFKTTDWFAQLQHRRYTKALQALEAGVEQTYRTYVKAIKDARADGHLTPDERAEARRLALDTALQFARTQGIDLLRTLGQDYLDLHTAKLVKQLKGTTK